MTVVMKRIALTVTLVLLIVAAGFWWVWGVNFQSVNFHATEKSEIRDSVVNLAIGDILLFKTPASNIGAIRFEKMTDNAGVDYVSWFIPYSSTKNTFEEVAPHKGRVFEKYWRTRDGSNSYIVKDIGGNQSISCGPVRLGWSASTWVYFQPGYEITVIVDRDINEFEISDIDLIWHKTKSPSHSATPGVRDQQR